MIQHTLAYHIQTERILLHNLGSLNTCAARASRSAALRCCNNGLCVCSDTQQKSLAGPGLEVWSRAHAATKKNGGMCCFDGVEANIQSNLHLAPPLKPPDGLFVSGARAWRRFASTMGKYFRRVDVAVANMGEDIACALLRV